MAMSATMRASAATGAAPVMPPVESARPSAHQHRHRGEVGGAVDQHQRRGAGEGPAGLAPEPAHPDQFADPARGDRHREAAEEMGQVAGERGGQPEAAREEVPAQAAQEVVEKRQREERGEGAERQFAKLGQAVVPSGRGRQSAEAGQHQREQPAPYRVVAPAARGRGRGPGERIGAGHRHCGPVSNGIGQKHGSVSILATIGQRWIGAADQ